MGRPAGTHNPVRGTGLGGRVVATARPGRVEDYAADPRISHEYDKPVTAECLRVVAARRLGHLP